MEFVERGGGKGLRALAFRLVSDRLDQDNGDDEQLNCCRHSVLAVVRNPSSPHGPRQDYLDHLFSKAAISGPIKAEKSLFLTG